ncbi:MAG: NAD(P)H-dependent oxidoreductase subunit E [candidate division Zixibacteria bacterium HGW-Zixibacteria-1]|nr:MAG: NAD(P)H-dependent oxidoreductase subunit E [candidate division Zixibacteria bacterium HGW-Zixibacteria-1]
MVSKVIRIDKVREIINRSPKIPGSLITVLQDIQCEFQYLPRMGMEETAKELNVPLSKVCSVATFYNAFSLTPRGENIIRVCKGTACHIKGADLILEQLETGLGLKPGETSGDLKYTVEVVNCVGACAMAPLMIVNNKYHGNVRCDKALKLVKKD